MNDFVIGNEIGNGTFGHVFLGVHKSSGEKVAIKCMKKLYNTWEECLGLKELRSLYEMSSENHPNIVQLQQVIREKDSRLYFVFEYMPDGNLYEFILRHTPGLPSNISGGPRPRIPVVTEHRIQSILSQVLSGLAFLHSRGYVHRDIKPENLLLKGDSVKLADFGLVRECACEAPITEYVSTRWYRAPEILLRSKHYGKPVDLFALGCIMAEIFSKIPLFPGETEPDQVSRLVDVLGSPRHSWDEGMKLAEKLGWPVDRKQKYTLQSRVPSASQKAIALMKDLLQWNPDDRPTCAKALSHGFFRVDTSLSQGKRPSEPLVLASPPLKRRRTDRDISPRSIQDVGDSDQESSPRSIQDVIVPLINSTFYCEQMPSVPFHR